MYDFNIAVLVIVIVLTAALLAMKIRFSGMALSAIDMIVGLLIMGVLGPMSYFTPLKLPLSIINTIGVIVLVKGVYCFVLSRR